MSVKNKLILSTSAVFVILLFIGATVLFGYHYVRAKASLANELDKESMYLQMMLRGINEVIITEGTPQSIKVAEEGITGFNEIHTGLLTGSLDTDVYETLSKEIDPRWQIIKEDIKPFLERDLDVEADGLMIKYGKVITEADTVVKIVNDLSRKTRAVVNSSSSKSGLLQNIMIAAIIIILITFAFISYQTYRSITAPIKDLMYIAEGFKCGDLSISMDESKRGEFGLLASHLNEAISRLNSLIRNVKSSTARLAINSENLSASITQIASNNREQSTKTTQAAAATEELNSSFQSVAQNAVNAAESSREATELAVNGGDIVNETVKGMNMIAESVRESSVTIEALGGNSERIGEIIDVISDIAEQTNLLALNAAIEAARAGDQGRGFAVVADEVRKLAEKTTRATREIVDMINTIQEDTKKAVKTMQAGTERVDKGVGMANEAGQSLQKIVSSVQNVTDMIQQIATAAEEQSTTGGDIATNLESVARLTQQTADGAQESSTATNSLNDLAQELKQLVSEFTLQDVTSSTRNQNEQPHQGEGDRYSNQRLSA